MGSVENCARLCKRYTDKGWAKRTNAWNGLRHSGTRSLRFLRSQGPKYPDKMAFYLGKVWRLVLMSASLLASPARVAMERRSTIPSFNEHGSYPFPDLEPFGAVLCASQ